MSCANILAVEVNLEKGDKREMWHQGFSPAWDPTEPLSIQVGMWHWEGNKDGATAGAAHGDSPWVMPGGHGGRTHLCSRVNIVLV